MGPTSGPCPATLQPSLAWPAGLASLALSRWCQGVHPATPSCLDTPPHLLSLEDGDWPWICFSLTFYELDSLLTRVHSEPLYEILCHLTISFETSLSGLFLFLFSVVWTWVHIWLLCDPHGFPPGPPLQPLLLIFVLLVFSFFGCAMLPTPVFWPREFLGSQSLTTEQLALSESLGENKYNQ